MQRKPHGLQRTGSRETGDGEGNDEPERPCTRREPGGPKLTAGDTPPAAVVFHRPGKTMAFL